MVLRVSLLGEQVVADADGAVLSRSSRSLALIGYLALHAGVPQGRQLIAGLFWPDSGDAQALTNLRRELHHLRSLVGEESLVVTSRDLCWCDSGSCEVDVRVLLDRSERAGELEGEDDAARERAAAEGVAAYGGDFLPAVYDDWAVAAREDLRRRCVDLCDVVVDLAGRRGDLRVAIDAARRRVALEPLEEAGHQALMRLHAQSGDRAAAIHAFHHCASVLEAELGVAPGLRTLRTFERLMGQRSGPSPPVGARQRDAASLVGREAAVTGLLEQWRATLDQQHARVVVVRGDPGVGKSRLVAELVERVRAGPATVATAQCFDSSGRLALAAVADWLRTPDLRTAARTLDPVWRAEVERLVPDDDTAAGTGSSPRGTTGTGERALVDAWQQHRFFEGLAQAFLAVPRPVLLVLDNLQWCDGETLAWLSFLLGLAPGRPVLVAVTLRDVPGDRAPTEWLARLRSAHPVEEVGLTPLSAEKTAVLAATLTGRELTAEESALLHATTGGFPLHVVEATRVGQDARSAVLPHDELGAVLRHRIEQTSPQAQETAGLAAALGRDVTLDLLTDASDLDADTVARAVDELWRHRILREVGTGYDFSHDLLRDAAYDRVSPPRRWLLHRRLAQALELSSAGREDGLSSLLAEQYERGGRPERAVVHYRRAAEVAAARFAPAEAIRLHRRTLDLVAAQPAGRQRDERELESLLALAAPLNALHGYASEDLHQVLRRAVRLAEEVGSSPLLVRSLVSLWTSAFVRGDIDGSRRLAERALDLSADDPVLLGQAHFGFGGSLLTAGDPVRGIEHFDRAQDLCRDAESLAVGSRPEVHALAWAAHAHWLVGQPGVAADRAAEAVARARDYAHPYSLAVALAYAGVTQQLLGDRDALGVVTEELDRLCERYGFAYYREWGLVLGGWLQGGDEGLARLRTGTEQLRRQLSLARMPYWLSLQADVQLRSGRVEAAAATLDAARTSTARGDAWWLPEILRVRAGLSAPGAGGELLAAGLQLATRHGSRALEDRCRDDLGGRSEAFEGVVPAPNAARTPAS